MAGFRAPKAPRHKLLEVLHRENLRHTVPDLDGIHDLQHRLQGLPTIRDRRDARQVFRGQTGVEEGQRHQIRHPNGTQGTAAERQHRVGQHERLEDGDGHGARAAHGGAEAAGAHDRTARREGPALQVVGWQSVARQQHL